MRPDPAGNPLLTRRLQLARRPLLFAAASAAVALLAAACSGGGNGTGAVSGTITIAAAPGVNDAPLYLALQKHLFADAGLQVVIKDFGSQSAELAAIKANQAQIAASDYGNIFAMQEAYSNLRLLADGYDAGAGSVEIVTLPKYNVTSALDLQGPQSTAIGLPIDSILATTPTGVPESLYAAAAREVMSNYLASGADTLTWKHMPQQQEISELAAGTLHAALLTQPYLYEAEASLGAVPVLDTFSGGTASLPISGYVATSTWAKGNAAAVADFQSAMAQAQSDASMTGPVQQILPTLRGAGITTQDADMVSLGTYPVSTSLDALRRVTELMTTQSMLSQANPVNLQKMLVGTPAG